MNKPSVNPTGYIKKQDACERMGVTIRTFERIVHECGLSVYTNPLNRRVVLFSEAEIDALLNREPMRVEHPSHV